MSTVFCLDCDRKLTLTQDNVVGDIIICDSCEAEFQIVSIEPPEIAWLYDDYEDEDWDDDNWDEDDERANGRYSDWDDDDEGEWSWMVAKQRRHHAQSHAQEQLRERRARVSQGFSIAQS